MDNISSYSGSVVAGDWAYAIAAWFAARYATGGTLNIDVDITLKLDVGFVTSPYAPVPLSIISDGSKLITADAAITHNLLDPGNIERFSLRDLHVIGTGAPANVDCGSVVQAAYTEQLNVDRCTFAGLLCNSAIIVGTSASAYIRDCLIDGGAHLNGAIQANGGFRHLSVKNTRLVDHHSLRNVYHSKTPVGVTAWIKATGGNEPSTNSYSSLLDVENCVGDEGAAYGVWAHGVERVVINKFSCNVGAGFGTGIYLENVRSAMIQNCWLGYPNIDTPAVRLINCGDVVIENLQVGQGVKRVIVDANTRLTLRNSPGVVVERI